MKQILDGIWNAQPNQIITWLAIAVAMLAGIYCLLAFLIFKWMK